MTNKDVIEKKIIDLKSLADEIEAGVSKLIPEIPVSYKHHADPFPDTYHWETIPEAFKPFQREIERKYQLWYSAAYQLVKENLNDREEEFSSYYEQNSFNGIRGLLHWLRFDNTMDTCDKNKLKDNFIKDFDMQLNILMSIPLVIDVKEMNLRKIIVTDFIESELDKADHLFRTGFERCAGVLAGVALERYLRALCDKEKVDCKYDDTIEPLAQALYAAKKIDSTELKKFQHLGGIRNDCAHPKDVSEEDLKARAKELVEKVKRLPSL